jgi:hypothetical protein
MDANLHPRAAFVRSKRLDCLRLSLPAPGEQPNEPFGHMILLLVPSSALSGQVAQQG